MEKPIAFYPQLARELGDIASAIYYQQLYYWRDKGKRDDGWIYKSVKEIEEETTLTRKQQDRIRKNLLEKGWIEAKKKMANGAPTYHYRCLMMIDVVLTKVKFRSVPKGQNEVSQRDKSEVSQRDNSITENTREYNNTREFKTKQRAKIDFDIFWQAYGKKYDKPKCKTKWDRLKLTEQHAVLEYIPKYLSTIKDKQFQKYPATFLNNRSWENEIDDKPKYEPNLLKHNDAGMKIFDPMNIASWSDMMIIEKLGVAGLKKYRGDDFKI
jgi:hypothetical protein